jgi:2-polyprenyl-3-methyl-5-hydroxy-6-metoxy-1,4-benzoquinol methylase
MTTNIENVKNLMKNYTVDNLKGISKEEFEKKINQLFEIYDYEAEGYTKNDLSRQRGLSINFTWGHDHDFGDFQLEGRMGDRHIQLLNRFCNLFDKDLEYFKGKRVLDIGCWTGGTSLLLAALGAEVYCVEEVTKYSKTVEFLKESFALENVHVLNKNLYELNDDQFMEKFDVIYFPGVLYHLSDPLIALRILYNCCKIGGFMFLETAYMANNNAPVCEFQGGTWKKANSLKNQGGWNWFIPTRTALFRMMEEAGFENISSGRGTLLKGVDPRIHAFGEKTKFTGITKAGLSVPGIK